MSRPFYFAGSRVLITQTFPALIQCVLTIVKKEQKCEFKREQDFKTNMRLVKVADDDKSHVCCLFLRALQTLIRYATYDK